MNYKCTYCKYTTSDSSNLKKHNNTKKHLKKYEDYRKNNKDRICEYCDIEFSTIGNLTRHLKTCKTKNNDIEVPKKHEINNIVIDQNSILFVEIIKLKDKQLDEKDNKLKEKDEEINKLKDEHIKSLQQQVDELKKEKDIQTEKKDALLAHGGLGYCKKNYPDADVITSLDYNSVYPQEDKFEELLVYYHQEKTLYIFFGKGIINEYKKADPQEQALWCSDTSRLSYIIREAGARQDKWTSDKKGLKFVKYVIRPVLTKTNKIINEFIKSLKPDENAENFAKIVNLKQSCLELSKYLDSDKLENDILEYIAPHFKLDMN